MAPCTKVQEFHGKFVEGVQNRNLHTVFPYQFRFRDGRQKNVVISMFYSGSTETVWVLVQRPQLLTAAAERGMKDAAGARPVHPAAPPARLD